MNELLLPDWINYMEELESEDEDTPVDTIINDLQRRLNNQGSRHDMHLELFYYDNVMGLLIITYLLGNYWS